MNNITYIDQTTIRHNISFPELIEKLFHGFNDPQKHSPVRHHHQYQGTTGNNPSTLLLMPCWEDTKKLGVKLVTVSPENSKQNLPAVQGLYILFDTNNGKPLAMFDGVSITLWRTAATSALASKILSKKENKKRKDLP